MIRCPSYGYCQGNTSSEQQTTVKNVAAYCRVSTKSQEQLDLLAAQESYYEERIKANPNWKFAGPDSDVGSRTTIEGRKRVNALVSACRHGKVDMVLIKSAHRFARNTVDVLETIRMLHQWKVDIYFESNNIHIQIVILRYIYVDKITRYI